MIIKTCGETFRATMILDIFLINKFAKKPRGGNLFNYFFQSTTMVMIAFKRSINWGWVFSHFFFEKSSMT